MELLTRTFCQIICKKLPAEIQATPNMHTKIRLVPPKVQSKRLAAVLRLTNPRPKSANEDGEMELTDKALAVNGAQAAFPYHVLAIN